VKLNYGFGEIKTNGMVFYEDSNDETQHLLKSFLTNFFSLPLLYIFQNYQGSIWGNKKD